MSSQLLIKVFFGEEFMRKHLDMEESEVPTLCYDLYKEYGTTMAGLKVLGYDFDNDEFHAYVHGRLPYETLKPDPVLRNLLLSMPQRKIIFTNADRIHAAQVLYRLGLEDCFEGVICFETLNPSSEPIGSINASQDKPVLETGEPELVDPHVNNCIQPTSTRPKILCKPSLEAIEAAILIANIDPKKTIFFDDSVRNVASGKLAGLLTVIVGSQILVPGADYALSSIHNIREALPEIWDDEGDQPEQAIQSSAETVVLA